ncbi:transmembrane protein 254 isoform X2 [Ahaetulla prasina]|uniref:transmembrane protein 254 isoform X2 n=1 Tax=Ahaetulla prasina TaxID=499056 RepID=UPI00264705B0|nr:transmembrane protein 254 isoform X2 [Ahaetulla prasina]
MTSNSKTIKRENKKQKTRNTTRSGSSYIIGNCKCAVLAPSRIPYDGLGPLGRFTQYLQENHKRVFHVGYAVAWLLHIGEACLSIWLCKTMSRKGTAFGSATSTPSSSPVGAYSSPREPEDLPEDFGVQRCPGPPTIPANDQTAINPRGNEETTANSPHKKARTEELGGTESTSNQHVSPAKTELRRSSRRRERPVYMCDYECK